MKVDDKQRQQYNDAFVQAEAATHGAEVAVTQAQVAYDAARQAEASGVQAAEQQVALAQTNLDKLRAGADADELAAAQPSLAWSCSAKSAGSGRLVKTNRATSPISSPSIPIATSGGCAGI